MTTDARTHEIAAALAKLTALIATESSTAAQPDRPRRAMPERVLLTVAEAAERLNIGKTKAQALISSGEIESVRIGRLRRVHVDAINAYAARLVHNHRTRQLGTV